MYVGVTKQTFFLSFWGSVKRGVHIWLLDVTMVGIKLQSSVKMRHMCKFPNKNVKPRYIIYDSYFNLSESEEDKKLSLYTRARL